MRTRHGFGQRFWSLAAAGAVLAGAVSVCQAAGKVYRWTDENGVVHYSDKLPPASSKEEHKVLDQRGQMVDQVDRAKSQDERLQEQLQSQAELAEQRRQAEAEARQRRRDQILLQTFTTERDLLLTRDDRLNAIDSIINLTVSNNERIDEQLAETRRQIETLTNSGREVPENITRRLESLEDQRRKNQEFIDRKREERRQEEERFAADLKRFRELKNIETADEDGQTDPTQAETQAAPESGSPSPDDAPPPPQTANNTASPEAAPAD